MIVVGDRGMFNAKVIARIEELKLEYIAGVKMRQDWDVKKIVLENKAPFETVTENLKVKLVELGEERYIVCLNEEEAKRDQAVREEIVSELREKIAKGPKKMIGNTGYRRYLSVDRNAVQIDEKKIASEKKFDGIYVLRTNTDLSAKDAALAYKGLWQVERAFREIKTVLDLSPSWPPLPGDYTVLDKEAAGAICTLADEDLYEALRKTPLPGVALVGMLTTENLGIERLVRNVVASPSISWLLLCGTDSRGHRAGECLAALGEKGVDSEMRIVRAQGKRARLVNLSFEEMEAFRRGVRIVPRIGLKDIAEISRLASDFRDMPSAEDWFPVSTTPPTWDTNWGEQKEHYH